jgi:hypothetical protein
MSNYWTAVILTGIAIGASLGKPYGYVGMAAIAVAWILRKEQTHD